MESLIESRVSFDIDKCLTGPFYATLYTTGATTPLWKELGQFYGKNIQGQRYVKNDDDDDATCEGKVINYSEIFGRALHLKAYGKWRETASNDVTNLPFDTKTPKDDSFSSTPFSGILSFFQNNIRENNQSSTTGRAFLTCPVDYGVAVNKATISLFGTDIAVPISGTGALRVLYADPRLRIFVSPRDTTDSRWEKAGLKVVQVRIDLVDTDWKELAPQ